MNVHQVCQAQLVYEQVMLVWGLHQLSARLLACLANLLKPANTGS